MIRIPVVVKAFSGLASIGLLLDTFQPTPVSAVDAAGRLSLDAVLVAGVIALWRELRAERARIAEKDEQVVAMATDAAKTMTLLLETVRELRGSINALRDERIGRRGSG